MEKRKRCELAWCESPHDADSAQRLHHRRQLGEYRTDTATIRVVIRWAERRDGRMFIEPHITIYTDTSNESHVLDLTAREARIWAGQLDAFTAAPWLAEKLRAGADFLHEYEVDEFAGVPHRVADRPTEPPASYAHMLRTVVQVAETLLTASEGLPVATMEVFELGRWVDELRGMVRYLVDAFEQLGNVGGLA